MQIDDRLGTFDEILAAAAAHAATLTSIRALIADLDPDATEAASRKERSVWWGAGPGKMTHGYAYAMPHSAHVNLGFFHGTSLPDPDHRLEGTGQALRHVKLKREAEVADPAIRALVIAARDERRATTARMAHRATTARAQNRAAD
ncbi:MULTISPECIES: DUF1801 domain-containing protein [unclassified Meridianimarinicoccus]|uniref:DUF1801 domain-containing protein n=1 Tax=unclassified Meridianimarinicoccus TaxID=2923344 RepID=UPI00186661D3|nr:DUF1801 domain-containing protein [Fluviibacterium sp. MJW13]